MLGKFEYKRIRSIEEGCHALAAADGNAAVLAGGTDLLVEIRNGLKSPRLLVDCKDLEDLKTFELNASGASIGASVPLNRLIEHRAFGDSFPALVDAMISIGTYQLRNRATLIGNLCNASPAADSAPVLLVLGATVEIAGSQGPRSIPLREFFTGVKTTVLRVDEIVTSVRVPRSTSIRTAFRKQQRIRGHDLAVVNLAGAYTPGSNTLTLAIGSCAPTPVLLDPIVVAPQELAAIAGDVVERVLDAVSPISDVRASAEYRKAVLPVLVKRLLQDLFPEGGVS